MGVCSTIHIYLRAHAYARILVYRDTWAHVCPCMSVQSYSLLHFYLDSSKDRQTTHTARYSFVCVVSRRLWLRRSCPAVWPLSFFPAEPPRCRSFSNFGHTLIAGHFVEKKFPKDVFFPPYRLLFHHHGRLSTSPSASAPLA